MSQFSEVIRPPIYVIAFIYFIFLSMSLAIWAALDNPAGLTSLVIFTLLIVPIYRSLCMKISVDDELRVGRAHLELKYIKDVRQVSGEEYKELQTKDARAFLALRFWSKEGVIVELNDQRDPTPYWLISSKKSDALMRSLYKQR